MTMTTSESTRLRESLEARLSWRAIDDPDFGARLAASPGDAFAAEFGSAAPPGTSFEVIEARPGGRYVLVLPAELADAQHPADALHEAASGHTLSVLQVADLASCAVSKVAAGAGGTLTVDVPGEVDDIELSPDELGDVVGGRTSFDMQPKMVGGMETASFREVGYADGVVGVRG
jgi:hypothetical protein